MNFINFKRMQAIIDGAWKYAVMEEFKSTD